MSFEFGALEFNHFIWSIEHIILLHCRQLKEEFFPFRCVNATDLAKLVEYRMGN